MDKIADLNFEVLNSQRSNVMHRACFGAHGIRVHV